VSERIAAAVSEKPRRTFGFGAVLAVLGLAVVLLVSGMSGSSNAASTSRHARQHAKQHAATGAQQQAINAKVNALLARMNVNEKFGQLEMAGPSTPTGSDLIPLAEQGKIGSVLDLTGVDNINAVQKAAVQNSPLHIPLIFGLDVIHGYRTMLPVPLGEAATWDPAQVQQDESVSADEAAADGIKWTFSPMVDISRDPRWGRVVEGAGEDPFLGSAIAAAKVKGYQGNNFAAADKVAATIKHFGGYGAPVAGREYNTVDMSTQQLFNDYLPPYKAAVDAGAATVMSSFNSLNGVPNTANPYLLTQILRDEWGFGGTTLSDYQAVQELEDFGYASDGADAARLALTAGENIEMAVSMTSTNPVYDTYETYGPQLLQSGKITMTQLNDAVRHVLTLKYLAGMFSDPYQGIANPASRWLTPPNVAVARKTADESMVLLNDNNHALPLSPSVGKVAVVGPLADDPVDQLGPDVPIGYDTTSPNFENNDQIVTVRQGIANVVGQGNVSYVDGCTTFTVADPCNETTGFQAAAQAAQASAVTVVMVGEPAGDSGEASSRTSLDLPGQQEQLVQQIAATGKPYVVVLMNGRPLTIPELAVDNPTTGTHAAPALLEAWYPGTTGGDAVADVLFGKVDPGRQAADVVPPQRRPGPDVVQRAPDRAAVRSEQQVHVEVSRCAQHTTVPVRVRAVVHDVVDLEPADRGHPVEDRHVQVSATIKNTGSTPGDDVVQLYLHEDDTSILQPVEKLEGFQRVSLPAGQSQRVMFTLGPQNLGFYNNNGQFVVEPGPFRLWVSDSSDVSTLTPTMFTLR
jgi:beta-glucosidase